MNIEYINKKRVMHIDTSSKLYERKHTGIAYKIIKSESHKGLALSKALKKEIERDLNADYDYSRVYSICIYYLIKEDFDNFDVLVICGDENYIEVKQYLDLLFLDNLQYLNKEILSLNQLRDITGNKRLKSYADNTANSYRKRALKCTTRQQKGLALNLVRVGYKEIKEKWAEIDKKLGKSDIDVSGE